MKCKQSIINEYITPTKSIDPSATKINSFSKNHKKLFQNGKKVDSLSK